MTKRVIILELWTKIPVANFDQQSLVINMPQIFETVCFESNKTEKAVQSPGSANYANQSIPLKKRLTLSVRSHFVMHSVWNKCPHGVVETSHFKVIGSKQVEQAMFILSNFCLNGEREIRFKVKCILYE